MGKEELKNIGAIAPELRTEGSPHGMVNPKGWKEFQDTGLLLLANQFLHIFGWAIVFEIDDENHAITNVYPARVKFRGFQVEDSYKAYWKITKYMAENIDELKKEA